MAGADATGRRARLEYECECEYECRCRCELLGEVNKEGGQGNAKAAGLMLSMCTRRWSQAIHSSRPAAIQPYFHPHSPNKLSVKPSGGE